MLSRLVLRALSGGALLCWELGSEPAGAPSVSGSHWELLGIDWFGGIQEGFGLCRSLAWKTPGWVLPVAVLLTPGVMVLVVVAGAQGHAAAQCLREQPLGSGAGNPALGQETSQGTNSPSEVCGFDGGRSFSTTELE